jgi:hypothetical protein
MRARAQGLLLGLGLVMCAACKPGPAPDDKRPAPPASVALIEATPVTAFLEAGVGDESDVAHVRDLAKNGQVWMARLLIEPRALSPQGTREELELLLDLCSRQGDDACVQNCAGKLGRKVSAPMRPDAGARDAGAAASDLGRAKELVAAKQPQKARALLEPKVLAGNASVAEIKLLGEICKGQGDKMCVALCEAKAK